MRYAPLAVVLLLVAAHVLLTGSWAVETLGLVSDAGRWRAILYVELALPLFVLWPAVLASRRDLGGFVSSLAAGFLASSAMMFIFAYLSSPAPVWQSRAPVLAMWVFCGGLTALAARLDRTDGRRRLAARIGLVCVTGLPLLWHYFALEYAQKSLSGLQSLSPHWVMGADPTALGGGPAVLPLVVTGSIALTLAVAWPQRREAAP